MGQQRSQQRDLVVGGNFWLLLRLSLGDLKTSFILSILLLLKLQNGENT